MIPSEVFNVIGAEKVVRRGMYLVVDKTHKFEEALHIAQQTGRPILLNRVTIKVPVAYHLGDTVRIIGNEATIEYTGDSAITMWSLTGSDIIIEGVRFTTTSTNLAYFLRITGGGCIVRNCRLSGGASGHIRISEGLSRVYSNLLETENSRNTLIYIDDAADDNFVFGNHLEMYDTLSGYPGGAPMISVLGTNNDATFITNVNNYADVVTR